MWCGPYCVLINLFVPTTEALNFLVEVFSVHAKAQIYRNFPELVKPGTWDCCFSYLFIIFQENNSCTICPNTKYTE